MRLTAEQLRQLDALLKKCTVMNSDEPGDIRGRKSTLHSLKYFFSHKYKYEEFIRLEESEFCINSKEFFTEVIRICFPGQEFTCQEHTKGRDRKKSTDTKDFSGAKAYVFTLPTTTIRFCTKLFMRDPDFGVVHKWYVKRDNETPDPYDYDIKCEDLLDDYENHLVDTDDYSLPNHSMDMVYIILDILHTRLSRLEAACVKTEPRKSNEHASVIPSC
jgi:hypothetical protein